MIHEPQGDAPRIAPDMSLPKLIPGTRIVLTDSATDWLSCSSVC